MWHHWKRHYCKWALLPRHPSTLHNTAVCHLKDLHHLSIDKVTQHKKIGLTIASESRMTLGEGRGDQLPPPHAWIGLLIADMFQDGFEEWIIKDCGLSSQGGNVIVLDDDHSERDSLLMMWGMLDSAWVVQSIGQGERLTIEMMVSTVQEGHQSHSRSPSWEKELRPGDQDTPKEPWRPTGPLQQLATSKSKCKA